MEKNIGHKTNLGFVDISKELKNKSLDWICKYDVVRSLFMDREILENHKGDFEKIYYFFSREYGLKGRVFPIDEIISLNENYDIIIQTCKRGSGFPSLNVDAHIFHDFFKGEELTIKISRMEEGKDPSFKLFNHIGGFVKNWGDSNIYNNLGINSIARVEVVDIWGKNGRIHPLVKPIELLNEHP